MVDFAFETNRGRCKLPDIPRVADEPYIDDCSFPEISEELVDSPNMDTEPLPYAPDCPEFSLSSRITLTGYGPATFNTSGGRRIEDICPGECGYDFDLNLKLPIRSDLSETGYIPAFEQSPPRRVSRSSIVGIVAIDASGSLVIVDP